MNGRDRLAESLANMASEEANGLQDPERVATKKEGIVEKANGDGALNVEMLQRVRNRIACMRGKHTFDMGDWVTLTNGARTSCPVLYGGTVERIRSRDCGTAACIAGWTVIEGWDELEVEEGSVVVGHAARDLLGLSPDDADYLFLGKWAGCTITEITRREALDYLDECIEAGEVVRR